MKICVTGGAGFIGRALCLRLIADGHEVRAIDRDISNTGELQQAGVEILQGDITGDINAEKTLNNCDVLIHTASLLGPQGLPHVLFYRANVEGTKKIVGAAIQLQVPVIIHFSSTGVLGMGSPEPMREDASAQPIDAYDKTKYEAEQWVVEQADKHSGITVIRPAWVYGPGDRRTYKFFRAIQKRKMVFVGDGAGLQHPVHINDLVDGVILAMQTRTESGEVFHLGGPEILTIREMVEVTCELLQVQVPPINLPYKPMRLLGQVVEKVWGLLRIDPPLSVAKVDFFVKNRAYSIEKAKRCLGYAPRILFQDGLSETLDWYKQKQWL